MPVVLAYFLVHVVLAYLNLLYICIIKWSNFFFQLRWTRSAKFHSHFTRYPLVLLAKINCSYGRWLDWKKTIKPPPADNNDSSLLLFFTLCKEKRGSFTIFFGYPLKKVYKRTEERMSRFANTDSALWQLTAFDSNWLDM